MPKDKIPRMMATATWCSLALFVAISVAGCRPSGTNLEAQVVEGLRANPHDFHLGREISGSWDRVCIANPYTSQERLDELLARL